jgi:hypothetical protein
MPARYDLSNVSVMFSGMGQEKARLSGYWYGYTGNHGRNWCLLTFDTEEWWAWQDGFTEGDADANGDSAIYDMVTRTTVHEAIRLMYGGSSFCAIKEVLSQLPSDQYRVVLRTLVRCQ